MKSGLSVRAVIPAPVCAVLERLEAAGYEAWCVGGCVRDTLLGRTPEDWDVTTEALPETVLEIFGDQALPTGLKHGTVTIRENRQHVEVTTYRVDGPYQDYRRPSSVTFTRSLETDLQRRDFTINALALGRNGELRDPFGGQTDLKNGVLRCVGDPARRFHEDALRIMRGLRFAAALGFSIAPDTAAGIRRNRTLLSEIAPERIQTELLKLLGGAKAAEILRSFPEVIGVFWPEILDMIGFEHRNIYHCYDVWEHTLHVLDAVPGDLLVVRTAALLHDIGKPAAFSVDAHGQGHFYAHEVFSRDLADTMLRRLKCANAFREQVLVLVEWHDRDMTRIKTLRRALNQLGEAALRQLIALKRADVLSQSPTFRFRLAELDQTAIMLDDLLARHDCVTLRQLEVNGRDMMQLGLSGSAIGATLRALLEDVMDGVLPNERTTLLDAARRFVIEQS